MEGANSPALVVGGDSLVGAAIVEGHLPPTLGTWVVGAWDRKELKRTLELEPGNAETLQLLVTLLYSVGREEEAKGYQAQLPAGAKVDATVLLNVGIKRYNDGNMEQALAEFERVVAENPELFQADQLHPTGAAQPVILDNVWKVVEPLLRKRAS